MGRAVPCAERSWRSKVHAGSKQVVPMGRWQAICRDSRSTGATVAVSLTSGDTPCSRFHLRADRKSVVSDGSEVGRTGRRGVGSYVMRARLAVLAVLVVAGLIATAAGRDDGDGRCTPPRLRARVRGGGADQVRSGSPTARRSSSSRLQQREADGGWSATRGVPAGAVLPPPALAVGRWLSSTPLTVRAPGAGDWSCRGDRGAIFVDGDHGAVASPTVGPSSRCGSARRTGFEWSERGCCRSERVRPRDCTATVGEWLCMDEHAADGERAGAT